MKILALGAALLCGVNGFGQISASLVGGGSSTPAPGTAKPADWDRKAAASYLDGRQEWWMTWPKAQRDHDTACVSCHTAVPYALSRPALRRSLGETGETVTEKAMLAHILKRVDLWSEVEPFYKDSKTGPTKSVESRQTEAVLNALILASYDAREGTLKPATRKAFDEAWKFQIAKGEDAGAWIWLNFHNGPWESDDSRYWGATLAAVAVGLAPEHYATEPAAAEHVALLRGYLTRNYGKQPLINQIGLLWASARVPGLLTGEERKALVKRVFACQAADGGWSLTALAPWKRRDDTPLATSSDGYATGLTVYALEQAGLAKHRVEVRRAVAWLRENQDAKTGQWMAYSVNKQRDLQTDIGRFMSDAATGYAVLALEKAPK